MSNRAKLAAAIAAVWLSACGGKKSEEAPAPSSAPPAAAPAPAAPAAAADPTETAKQVFRDRCVPCHGASGHGDGPAAATLNPKPRQYADKAWQASVTDEYLEKVIREGGASVGKSAAMPANPDIKDPAVISALKDIIRSFGK